MAPPPAAAPAALSGLKLWYAHACHAHDTTRLLHTSNECSSAVNPIMPCAPCLLQPAASTAAGPPAAAAPVTLVARQRPRKLASPSASSPTSSSAAKSAFRPATAGAAAPGADAAGPLPRRRCVLVAKQLTNSDASSGRIILPRVAGKTGALLWMVLPLAGAAVTASPMLAAPACRTPCMRHAWSRWQRGIAWMAVS